MNIDPKFKITDPKLRDILIDLPKTMASIATAALVVASILTMALSSLRETVIHYTPAENWMQVDEITIPDLDYRKGIHGDVVSFRRVITGPPITADWFSEVVMYDNAGIEFCRRRGDALYSGRANDRTIIISADAWFGDCRLPPGCYYQDLVWEFEVDRVRKSLHVSSNNFAVTDETMLGVCPEQDTLPL